MTYHRKDPSFHHLLINHQPRSPTVVKDTEYPAFEDIPEMRLHQPINTSTEAEPSHSIATSSQAIKGAPHASHFRGKRRLITSKSMIGMMKLKKKQQQQRKRS
jgi:hypothetical protein